MDKYGIQRLTEENQRLRRAVEELSILNEIALSISSSQSLEQILETIVKDQTGPLSEAVSRVLTQVKRSYVIRSLTLDPKVFTKVLDNGVLLTMRYLCRVRGRRELRMLLWEDVLREFAKHPDIDFAYPTTRYYKHAGEGPPDGEAS